MNAAEQEPGPAHLQEVDAYGLEGLFDDGRAEDGEEEEAAGLELADKGAEDAEEAADEGDEDGEEQAEGTGAAARALIRTA